MVRRCLALALLLTAAVAAPAGAQTAKDDLQDSPLH